MRIWEFSVRQWQFTLLLFGLLIAVGLNSYLNIPRSEDPEFHVPIPTIVAVYPGADPADIERLVVDPIEDAVNELDDVKRIDSRSLDGVGVVKVEFEWDSDADDKYNDVVREINRIRADLPADLASLEVRKAGSGLVNIVQLALVSADASYRELKELAEDLSDTIETLPGVRFSEAWAFPEPEVRVAVDLERMGRARITLAQVEAAIRGENARLPRPWSRAATGASSSCATSRTCPGTAPRSAIPAASMAGAPCSSRRRQRTASTCSRCATGSMPLSTRMRPGCRHR